MKNVKVNTLLTQMWVALLLIFLLTPLAIASDAEKFLSALKKHYQPTSSITAFSVTHSYLGQSNPYQSWDYLAPSRYKAFKVTDIDLDKKHYAQNVVHHFTGGMLVDEVHFQNSTQSLRYERNGITQGKQVLKQKMNSFERYKNLTLMNMDFFAVNPLLEEKNITENITIHKGVTADQTTILHKLPNNKIVEYTFKHNPLRLVLVNNKSRRRIYQYEDYQTTNGLTYARSLFKYYNDDIKPSFIVRIENFDMIDEIDVNKLQLPQGFGPIISIEDKKLTVESIAPDLYVISDSSNHRNILFQVTGSNISVFGAPVNTRLSKETIALIQTKFPQKRITSVYITHPYSDHIAGLSSYAKLGAVIRADHYTIAAIKAYPPFKGDISSFKFQEVKHQQLIDNMRFYVLENSRSKRQSFVYFENHGVIYQSDFLEVAFDNTIANIVPSYTKVFIDFVRSEKLYIQRIVGHHRNNNISVDVVNKVYESLTL